MSGTEPATDHPDAWAAPSVAPPELMAALQERLPVRLIATARQYLRMCRVDESIIEVVSRNKEGFDYFPVADTSSAGSDRIVGLVELARFRHGDILGGVVKDHMRPLSDENLMGGDASILSFIKGVDRHPCRLVVSGSSISGLVTLSDLQKLPVRAALFALITHFEIIMTEAIRRDCKDATAWNMRLSEGRRAKLDTKLQAAMEDDSWVDDLLFTEFADKVTIILKSRSFTESKTAFSDQMADVQKLRDNLAHANDYAGSREAAMAVCKTVRIIDTWIEHLSAWPGVGVETGG